jgi:glycosyltransferase involved in cell wall biosynthesis
LAGGEDGVVSAEIELLRSNGIEVELLSFSNEGSALLNLVQLPFNIGSYIKTRRHLRKFRPDIVHIHNLHFAASASVLFAVKHCKVPVVLTLHNFRWLCPSGTLYFNGNPYLKSIKSKFPWTAIREGVYVHSRIMTFWLGFSTWINRLAGAYRIPDRYIVLTGHAKTVFQDSSLKIDLNKMIVKPNFVKDPGVASLVRSGNFLYIGRLSEEKGILILLKAFAGISHKLTIIGEGPQKDLVEAATKDHSNITYLGYQQKDVITKEIEKCTALIFPSVWYETFGLTIIEAFASSTPVIASNIGSASLIIRDSYNGLHFKESNAADLRSKINQWVAFEECEKEKYRINARKSYETYYTPAENFKQLSSIYSSLANQNKQQGAIASRVYGLPVTPAQPPI